VERHAASIFVPPWLRLVYPLRSVLPLVASAVARRSLSALPSEEFERTTGVLGAGGAADLRARGAVGVPRPGFGPEAERRGAGGSQGSAAAEGVTSSSWTARSGRHRQGQPDPLAVLGTAGWARD
jgi:hypothetical protein